MLGVSVTKRCDTADCPRRHSTRPTKFKIVAQGSGRASKSRDMARGSLRKTPIDKTPRHRRGFAIIARLRRPSRPRKRPCAVDETALDRLPEGGRWVALGPAEQGEGGAHASPLCAGEVRVCQLGCRESYRVWERRVREGGSSAGLFMKLERSEEPGGAGQRRCRSILRRRPAGLWLLMQVTADTTPYAAATCNLAHTHQE